MALARTREPDEPESFSFFLLSHPIPTSSDIIDPAEETFSDDPSLTDEERIIRLLASNSGRMKQSRIVDETNWSKAMVSRLLSAMEEDNEITKLTVGREIIILLGMMDGVYATNNGSED